MSCGFWESPMAVQFYVKIGLGAFLHVFFVKTAVECVLCIGFLKIKITYAPEDKVLTKELVYEYWVNHYICNENISVYY